MSTKTSSTNSAATTGDKITTTLCNHHGDCCSSVHEGGYKAGSVDTFAGSELGDCLNFIVGEGDLSTTIMKTEENSTDSCCPEWVKIKLSGDKYYLCPFHGFIDGEKPPPRKRTSRCKGKDDL